MFVPANVQGCACTESQLFVQRKDQLALSTPFQERRFAVNRFKNRLVVVLLFAVVAVAVTLLNFRQAAAQTTPPPGGGSAPVTIVNPIPLPVTGTVGFASGSSINVSNPATSPVFVRDVDQRDRHPYQDTVSFIQDASTCPSNFVCTVTFKPVPAGYRLVITYVSAHFISGTYTHCARSVIREPLDRVA
jgi:hypothetical protein